MMTNTKLREEINEFNSRFDFLSARKLEIMEALTGKQFTSIREEALSALGNMTKKILERYRKFGSQIHLQMKVMQVLLKILITNPSFVKHWFQLSSPITMVMTMTMIQSPS